MKRPLQLLVVILLSIFMTACSDPDDNNEDSNNDKNTDTEDQTQDETDKNNDDADDESDDTANDTQTDSDQEMIDKMNELDYAEIEIEADYGKDNEYEAEIEQDKDKSEIEAELEDEVKENIDIKGEDAFDKIYPNVKKLTIDQGTSKEDAIDQVLKKFDLDSGYEEFELEITFQDGTELEFEDKK